MQSAHDFKKLATSMSNRIWDLLYRSRCHVAFAALSVGFVSFGFNMVVSPSRADGIQRTATATATIVTGTTNGITEQGMKESLLRDLGSTVSYFGVMWMSDIQTIRTLRISSGKKLVIQLEHYN